MFGAITNSSGTMVVEEKLSLNFEGITELVMYQETCGGSKMLLVSLISAAFFSKLGLPRATLTCYVWQYKMSCYEHHSWGMSCGM